MNRAERIADARTRVAIHEDLAHVAEAVAAQLARYAAICERARFIELRVSAERESKTWRLIASCDRDNAEYFRGELAELTNDLEA